MTSVDSPEILGSEAARSAYGDVLDRWDAGADIAAIRAWTLELEHVIQAYETREYVWGALARVYWEIGQHSHGTREQLARLLDSGASHEFWAAHADAGFAKRRLTTLQRLLTLTGKPRTRPRRRKTYGKVARRLYSVGDCLALDDGHIVHKGVVCEINERRGRCLYNVLVMEALTAADAQDFPRRGYFGHILPYHRTNLVLEYAAPHVVRVEHRLLMKMGNPFHRIGHIDLDETRIRVGSCGVTPTLKAIVEDFRQTPTTPGLSVLPLTALMAAGPG